MQAVVEKHSFLPLHSVFTQVDTTIPSNIAHYKIPKQKEKTFTVLDSYSKRMLIYPIILLLLLLAFAGMFSIGIETFGIAQMIKTFLVALGSVVPFYLTRWFVRTYYHRHKIPKKGREYMATRTYNRFAVVLFALIGLWTITQFSAVRFAPLMFAGATFVGSSSDTIQAVEAIKRKIKKEKQPVPEVVTEQKESIVEKEMVTKSEITLKPTPPLPKVLVKDTIIKVIELAKPIVKKEAAPIVPEPELRLLERAGKFGFKDLDGNTVIVPKYSIAYDFSEGLAQVQLDNKWGFINKKGELICPIQYDDCNPFSEGLAVVQKNGYYGYVNKDGKMRILPQYSSASNFKQGSAMVEKDGRKFKINNQGKE